MHGSIFVFFKRFIETKYDFNTWDELVKNSKTERFSYDMHEAYPDEDIHKLIQAASDMTQLPPAKLQEKFGEALVPNLLLIYNQYVDPKWKTLDMLENTERVMHHAVKKQDAKTAPPVLNVTRVNKRKLIIDYHSKRRMASLAIGIIKGIAKYYNEESNIIVESTTGPDDERVQIQVSYVD